MKIAFFTDTNNINTGSYRIWVNDLNNTLNENEVDSSIVYGDLKKINVNSDVVIFCKSSYKRVSEFKKINNKALIGAINVSCDHHNPLIDFVIVGSPEEYASLSSYNNVFIYPLIERKFENINRKNHSVNKATLKVCFHGNYPHLFKFEPFLKSALERFNKEILPIELHIITGNPRYKWEKGKPDVEIIMHGYDESFSEIIHNCDIGVVPNVSDVRLVAPDISKITSIDLGLYDTDYFLRLKNKTNAGRAYVFYQHGIPVIHDLSPSSFELINITGYNICAHDSNSWFRELLKLKDPAKREEVSKAYFEAFKKYYNPHYHAKKLIRKIKEIRK
mgnify:FL=1